MSVGYWLDNDDLVNSTNLLKHFVEDHSATDFGEIEKLTFSHHDCPDESQFAVVVSPSRRWDGDTKRQMISTGDNCVGKFPTREERDTYSEKLTDIIRKLGFAVDRIAL